MVLATKWYDIQDYLIHIHIYKHKCTHIGTHHPCGGTQQPATYICNRIMLLYCRTVEKPRHRGNCNTVFYLWKRYRFAGQWWKSRPKFLSWQLLANVDWNWSLVESHVQTLNSCQGSYYSKSCWSIWYVDRSFHIK